MMFVTFHYKRNKYQYKENIINNIWAYIFNIIYDRASVSTLALLLCHQRLNIWTLVKINSI